MRDNNQKFTGVALGQSGQRARPTFADLGPRFRSRNRFLQRPSATNLGFEHALGDTAVLLDESGVGQRFGQRESGRHDGCGLTRPLQR